jgi:hypothetical protein
MSGQHKLFPCAGNCGASIRKNATGLCAACLAGRRRSPETRPGGDSVRAAGDEMTVEKDVTEKVRTLDDLVRVCEIDADNWTIVSWECKASQMMSVPRAVGESQAWRRPSTEPVLTQLFHVSAKLRRKSAAENTMKALYAGLLADIRKEAGRDRIGMPARRNSVDDGFLFEFAPFDLHMGKYTWDDETVTNYDVDIAEDLFNQSLEFLLDRALKLTGGKIERVLCVFGNDVSHSDSKRGQTTAGTPLDCDSRYVRVYRRICAVHRCAIDRLYGVAPVDVQIVPGNHDELTSFHLGEVLAARYEGIEGINVYNSPRPRTYYSWGVNLFGFTHGDSENVAELPLAMAREVPELWAKCPSREFHIGHKHITEKWVAGPGARARVSAVNADRPGAVIQDYFSDKGVRIRRLTSLSGHDFWHTKHAYMDRRACEAFVFHRQAGFTGQLSFNVDHFTGKAVSK